MPWKQKLTLIGALLLCLATPAYSAELDFANDPSQAKTCANVAVESVQRYYQLNLDYSPASLEKVDTIILLLNVTGETEDKVKDLLVTLGCYAGEVIARKHNGTWAKPSDVLPANLAPNFPYMMIVVPGERVRMLNPIGKAFKLFENGIEDSIYHLYQTQFGEH